MFNSERMFQHLKLEIQRQDFLKAWQTAEKTALSRTMADIVNCIKINATPDGKVTLEATDIKTSVKCTANGVNVIEPGAALLPVAILGGILKKSTCDIFTLEVGDTKGMINSEGSKTKFPVIPLENFPNIPESDGADTICEILSTELSRIITEGSIASSQPQDFPKYIGTCLLRTSEHSLKVVSTDGKRLSISEVFCSVHKEDDVLLPASALKDLAKQLGSYEENVTILADGSTAWFSLENVEFSIRRVDAAFPSYERILNNEIYTELNIQCDKLMYAAERVDVIAKTSISRIMVIDMKPDNQLRITARSNEYGITGEALEAEISGNPLQIGFNSGYFIDGLRALGQRDIVIEFSGKEEQTRMTRKDDSSFLYMLMPARLTNQDIIFDELDNDSLQKKQEEEPHEEYEGEEPHEEHEGEPHDEYEGEPHDEYEGEVNF